jgi:4-hydroxy-tetrahydrodipicolinate reductase
MKLALLGYGKMGRLIEQVALQRDHEILCRLDSKEPLSTHMQTLQQSDLWIDFSHPQAVIDHVQWAVHLSKNLIIGTTGWEDQLSLVTEMIRQSSLGLLYSPNFSMGVHIFMKLVEEVAQWVNSCEDYDVAISESHHRHKVDSPSGTAQALAALLLKHVKRKTSQDLSISSSRCGSIPGTHTITMDSAVDSLTLTHTARHREGFALGAVQAAEWLQGKQGIYTLDDMLNG